MKKITVSDALCIGCGACIAVDSEHFDWSDDGLSQAISQTNLESSILLDAIESCPTMAIKLEEVNDSKVIDVDFKDRFDDEIAA